MVSAKDDSGAIERIRQVRRGILEWISEWDFAGLLDQIGAIDSPVYND